MLAALKPGHRGDVWLAETLASSVLAPRYEERQRHSDYEWRLSGFEAIPPSIRDQSKAILHHWARCLYHSGDPQFNPDVAADLCEERFQQAIDKLGTAIRLPRREGRDEHPSHLYNTLGTAYARYARCLENLSHPDAEIEEVWDKACEAFRKSIAILPSVEALLAFSHRLLMRAKVTNGVAVVLTSQHVHFVADALTLLDEAEEMMQDHANPMENWWVYLNNDRVAAMNWLSDAETDRYIQQLHNSNNPDLAFYCQARLAMYRSPGVTGVEAALAVLEAAHWQTGSHGAYLLLLYLSLLRKHPARRFTFDLQKRLHQQLERADGYTIRPIDSFRYAVLCYQTGAYQEGQDRFRRLRDQSRKTGGPQFSAQDVWRDPHDPENARVTQIRITRIVTEWRADGYVEELAQDVPLRPRHFSPYPREREPHSCVIRFGPNGPLAVPLRFEGIV